MPETDHRVAATLWRSPVAALSLRAVVGLSVVGLSVVGLSVSSCAERGARPAARAETLRIVEVEVRSLDEPAAVWRTMPFHEIPGDLERVAVRAAVDLPEEVARARPLGLTVQALATCAVSWDGEDLGASGRPAGPVPGTVAAGAGDAGPVPGTVPGTVDEVPGTLGQILHVPDRLATAGRHRLELTCSARHRGFTPTVGFWLLRVGPYDELLAARRVGLLPALLSLSGTTLVGLFALSTWLFDRRRRPADLWLGLFCLAVAGLSVAESWRRLVGYTYDWHLVRLRLVTVLSWLVVVLLVAYVVRRFPRARPGSYAGFDRVGVVWIGAVAVGAWVPALVMPAWDAKSTMMFLVALPVAAGWCVVAVWRGRRSAVAATVGIVACLLVLLWRPALFIDRMLYPAVGLLLLCLLIAHARETRATRRAAEAARLSAARLETELLRRQLQPHFLMNTLTALSEWVEEDPPTAVRMIGALADEMRALGRASTRSLVPLGEELALCRSHLELLELRRDVRYRLETVDVDESMPIPPAVLHTLVENAVTHGGASGAGTPAGDGGAVRLRLRQVDEHDVRRLIFEAPFGGAPRRLADSEGATGGAWRERPRPGTGLRYVEARLRQTYGDRWRFTHGPVDGPVEGIWRSVLELPVDGADHGDGSGDDDAEVER